MSALRGRVGIGAGIGTSVFSLRFLIDNALPPGLADLLCAAKHGAVHVRTYRTQAAKDEQIVARAIQDRIIVSADSDFSAILAARDADRPCFIPFREPDLMIANDYFNAMMPALPVLAGAANWPRAA